MKGKRFFFTILILSLLFNPFLFYIFENKVEALAKELDHSMISVFRGNVRFTSVTNASDGGYVAAGTAYGSSNLDMSGLIKGMFNTWVIVKYSATGELQWKRSFGGSTTNLLEDVKQTPDEGFVVAGTANTANGDMIGLSKGGLREAVLVKYDKNGTMEWKRSFGGSGQDELKSIAIAQDGGIIVAGHSDSNDNDMAGLSKGSYDAFVAKYDSSGTLLWKSVIGGTGTEYVDGISQLKNGDFAIVGSTESNDGDFTTHGKGLTDGFIARFDENGNLININTAGGSNIDEFNSISPTKDGGYVVAGYFSSNDGDFSGLQKGGSDAVIIKYDQNDQLEWRTIFGGTSIEVFESVIENKRGHFIAAGSTESVDGDLGSYNNNAGRMGIVVEFDENGSTQNVEKFGGSGTDVFHHIIETISGGYRVSGYTSSKDGDLMDSLTAPSGTGTDAIVVTYYYKGETSAILPIVGGDLGISVPQINASFGVLSLDKNTVTAKTDIDPFHVYDFTGLHAGYRVQVSATPFQEVGGVGLAMPSGMLRMHVPSSVEVVNGSLSIAPSVNGTSFILDSGSPASIASASAGNGAGEYRLSFASDALELTIDPTLVLIDPIHYPGQPTMFSSTINWEIVSGP